MSQHDCGLVWSARERWGMRGGVGVVGVDDDDDDDDDDEDNDGEDKV